MENIKLTDDEIYALENMARKFLKSVKNELYLEYIPDEIKSIMTNSERKVLGVDFLEPENEKQKMLYKALQAEIIDAFKAKIISQGALLFLEYLKEVEDYFYSYCEDMKTMADIFNFLYALDWAWRSLRYIADTNDLNNLVMEITQKLRKGDEPSEIMELLRTPPTDRGRMYRFFSRKIYQEIKNQGLVL